MTKIYFNSLSTYNLAYSIIVISIWIWYLAFSQKKGLNTLIIHYISSSLVGSSSPGASPGYTFNIDKFVVHMHIPIYRPIKYRTR